MPREYRERLHAGICIDIIEATEDLLLFGKHSPQWTQRHQFAA